MAESINKLGDYGRGIGGSPKVKIYQCVIMPRGLLYFSFLVMKACNNMTSVAGEYGTYKMRQK